MNDKLQYASMLEIPVSTCNITVKETKKKRQRRKKDIAPEEVKDRLIGQVNARSQAEESSTTPSSNGTSLETTQPMDGLQNREVRAVESPSHAEETSSVQTYDEARRNAQATYSQAEEDTPIFRIDNAGEFATAESVDGANNAPYTESANAIAVAEDLSEPTVQEGYEATSTVKRGRVKVKKERVRRRRSVNVITVQLLIIGVLVATIFVTNALYTDSGVNVFLRSVFGTESVAVDSRVYTDFAPVINDSDISGYTVEAGIINLSGEGSVYAPVDGTVSRLEVAEDGKITLEITHNKNFISVFNGLDYAYSGIGDTVYGNIPVGFIRGEAEMCFLAGDGQVISNYQVVDDAVVWAV